jgi:hypothetical protein
MATSGTFIAGTDNDNAVDSWMWEESTANVVNPGTWADVGTSLLNSGTISGETTLTLSIDSATIAESGTWVRCRADFIDGPVYSDPAELTVT